MSIKFHYGFCLSIINLFFLYNCLIVFNKETTKNYSFTFKYVYLSIYFSFICGLVSFFLLSSKANPTKVEDELEEGEITEETTRSSLSESQEDSDEVFDTVGELPGYNDTIYNIIDYPEN